MVTTQLTGRNQELIWCDLTPYDIPFQRACEIDRAADLVKELELACLANDAPRWLELECRLEIDRHVIQHYEDLRMRNYFARESRKINQRIDNLFVVACCVIGLGFLVWLMSY